MQAIPVFVFDFAPAAPDTEPTALVGYDVDGMLHYVPAVLATDLLTPWARSNAYLPVEYSDSTGRTLHCWLGYPFDAPDSLLYNTPGLQATLPALVAAQQRILDTAPRWHGTAALLARLDRVAGAA